MFDEILLNYILLVEDVSYIPVNEDDKDKKFALIEPLTAIRFNGFPANFSAILLYSITGLKSKNKYYIEVDIIDPDNNKLAELENDFEPIEGSEYSASIIASSIDIQLPTAGIYKFILKLDGRELGKYILFTDQME
ncbi:DUF6941 family protein [Paenibacillus rubinfantis]|uniref:DUF6941 family protein n=1 Tax=Paenibacillus rubinfantis TaxID=1720296 RepID=UPI00073F7D94|nr:hypothetical protein [Paenibacillus rubinfantis]